MLLNAYVIEPSIQSGATSTKVLISEDPQLVEAPCEPELTENMVSMTLGARLKVPKMTPSGEISTGQVGTKSPLVEQQQNRWQFLQLFKMLLPDRLSNQMLQSQLLVT